jgi:hypothetical protein
MLHAQHNPECEVDWKIKTYMIKLSSTVNRNTSMLQLPYCYWALHSLMLHYWFFNNKLLHETTNGTHDSLLKPISLWPTGGQCTRLWARIKFVENSSFAMLHNENLPIGKFFGYTRPKVGLLPTAVCARVYFLLATFRLPDH